MIYQASSLQSLVEGGTHERLQKCGATLVSERTTIEKPYRFVESGLSNIYLAGVTLHHCASCREYDVEIPKLGSLMDVIAGTLLRKSGDS